MKRQCKDILWLVFVLGWGLSACQGVVEPALATVAAGGLANPATTQAQPPQPTTPATTQTAGPTMDCKPFTNPFTEISAVDWVSGPADASVTLLDYSDFQWPYCAKLEPVLAQLRKDFPNELRFVYRHFPLISIHDKASLASQAAEAAGEQGKFWEMHALLFEKYSEWAKMPVDQFKAWLTTKSGEIGLDAKKFGADLTSQPIVDKVMQDYQAASSLGITGTPSLFINGQTYKGGRDKNSLAAAIKQHSQIKRFGACPPMTIDPNKQYTATLETGKGQIVIELYAKEAPVTVNSFVFLARQGWYDGVTFHRVIPQFVAQAGDPYGSGMGNPGYIFKNEITPGLTFAEAGVVGMARSRAPDTNGSQFFITLTGITKDMVTQLDGQYTIFGKVIAGLEVVDKLTPRDVSKNPNLPPGDKILKVTIEEK